MKNKLFILGEAYGEAEDKAKAPFVGPTGYELTRLLEMVDIRRADCYLSNVFNLRPAGNQIGELCGLKEDSIKGYPSLPIGYGRRGYIRKEFSCELNRLGEELLDINPNLVLALGNTACWAMLGVTAISKLRGVTAISTHTASGFKVLPTYHPAAIFKQYELRPIVAMDFDKARREQEFPEIRRPKREIWIEPSLQDLDEFHRRYIKPCKLLSVDIETAGNQVTCIGFAPFPDMALVIPFVDPRKLGRSYWASQTDEVFAWTFVKKVLESKVPKLFQNGLYDIAFLWRAYGIRVRNAEEDTMLLSHALQPESLKNLGFLGSIYTDEGAWKQMRQRKTTIKKDD